MCAIEINPIGVGSNQSAQLQRLVAYAALSLSPRTASAVHKSDIVVQAQDSASASGDSATFSTWAQLGQTVVAEQTTYARPKRAKPAGGAPLRGAKGATGLASSSTSTDSSTTEALTAELTALLGQLSSASPSSGAEEFDGSQTAALLRQIEHAVSELSAGGTSPTDSVLSLLQKAQAAIASAG